jgi:hypothetical protein
LLHAALVSFFADPDRLLAALEGASALPPLSTTQLPVLVAPGMPGLARPSDAAELALWQALDEPSPVAVLQGQGHSRGTIESFLTSGAAEQA